MTTGLPNPAPPLNELAITSWLCCTSCQATWTSPLDPTYGSAPITAFGPPVIGLIGAALLNVLPPSVERAKSSTSLVEDWPAFSDALSQPTYTESRWGLVGLVSTAIIGLSLNLPLPELKLKKVTCGQVAPWSNDFATATSVPW